MSAVVRWPSASSLVSFVAAMEKVCMHKPPFMCLAQRTTFLALRRRYILYTLMWVSILHFYTFTIPPRVLIFHKFACLTTSDSYISQVERSIGANESDIIFVLSSGEMGSAASLYTQMPFLKQKQVRSTMCKQVVNPRHYRLIYIDSIIFYTRKQSAFFFGHQ